MWRGRFHPALLFASNRPGGTAPSIQNTETKLNSGLMLPEESIWLKQAHRAQQGIAMMDRYSKSLCGLGEENIFY
jgi:hypothetical protein